MNGAIALSSLRSTVGTAALLLVSLGAVAGLAGCSNGGSPGTASGPATTSPSASSDPGPVTLRFAVYGGERDVASYARLVHAYTARHPQVTIEIQHTRDAAQAEARLDGQFAQGHAPDVFLLDHAALPSFVAAGRLQPVDELLEQRNVGFGESYQRLGLESFSADSSLQCMPNDVSPMVVYYNSDLVHPRRLAAKGETPPNREVGWTWAQFARAARAASGHGVKGTSVPASLWALTPLVRSAGADVVDDPRTPSTLTLAENGTRAALTQVLALARDPKVTPTGAQLARVDALERFERGRLAMLFGDRRLLPTLRRHARVPYDVFPMPTLGKLPRSIATVTGLCIARGTPHLQAAADFLAFASGTKGARISARSGSVVPANLPALRSQAFMQPDREPAHSGVFADSVRYSDAGPYSPRWPRELADSRPLVERLFRDRPLAPQGLLERMDHQSRTILQP
ncbi:MAG: extracellular solute-binding protein [Nocardioidaceae bacterium]